MLRRWIPLVLLLVLSAGPVSAQNTPSERPLPSIELPEELDRILREYERAWAAGDANALAALFTEDGFVPSPSGWVRGRAAIVRVYETASGDLRLRAHAYSIADSVGYIVGAYGYGDSAGEPDRGKFLLALRRDRSGKWLIAADLPNTNRR